MSHCKILEEEAARVFQSRKKIPLNFNEEDKETFDIVQSVLDKVTTMDIKGVEV